MFIIWLLWLLGWLALLLGIAGVIFTSKRALFGIVAGVGLLLAIGLQGAYCVPAGSVGVRKTLGSVHKKILQPGLNFVTPFVDSVVVMDTRLKSFPVDSPPSKSKDLQLVHTVIAVQHCLNGEMAADAYNAIGDISKFDVNVIAPAINEASKAVIGHFDARELIRDREKVKLLIVKAIQDNIDKTLNEKGVKGALLIANVAIKDFDFSQEFNKSIEQTMKAQQEALQADSDRQRRIILAEAKQKEQEIMAQADAYSVNVRSIAQAAAMDREGKALAANPDNLLRLRFLQQWNGRLPTFIGTQQPLTTIDGNHDGK